MNFMSKVANQLVEDGVANGQTIREIYNAIHASKHLGITQEQVADAVNAYRQANKVGDERQVLRILSAVPMPWDGTHYLAPPLELVSKELVGFAAFCKKYKFHISFKVKDYIEMDESTQSAWFGWIYTALQRVEATQRYCEANGRGQTVVRRDFYGNWAKLVQIVNN